MVDFYELITRLQIALPTTEGRNHCLTVEGTEALLTVWVEDTSKTDIPPGVAAEVHGQSRVTFTLDVDDRRKQTNSMFHELMALLGAKE